MVNSWPGLIANATWTMFERWIEYYIGQKLPYRSLPTESERRIFELSYNRIGQRQYEIKTLIGIEEGHCTTPHRFNKLDEFTMAFRDLAQVEQLALIGYVDPFQELTEAKIWKAFLEKCECARTTDYERLVKRAVMALQAAAEERGLVEKFRGRVCTWAKIAALKDVSVPTIRRMVERMKLPVYQTRGVVECDRKDFLAAIDRWEREHPWWRTRGE